MSKTLLAIDPGLRELGMAVFVGDELTYACLVRSPCKPPVKDGTAWVAMAREALKAFVNSPIKDEVRTDVLVSEVPQIYWQSSRGGNSDSLLQLCGVVGAVAHAIPHGAFKAYRPREWKGNVKAEVMLDRIAAKLTPAELATIAKCPQSLRHNVIDAIGIGLKYLGRL